MSFESEATMALLKIVVYPNPPLMDVAAPVTDFSERLQQLADDMLETMYHNEGVGLAAPQVGKSIRLIVYCDYVSDPVCLVNPEILERHGCEYSEEGCLSLPSLYATVPRAKSILVRAQDLDGSPFEFEAEDYIARIIQHECDHLEGKVFPDRLDLISKSSVLKEWEELVRSGKATTKPITD
jgi:peptide deformylase